MNVCITDIILGLCFLPALIDGLKKGFVKQVFALAAVIVGFVVAKTYVTDFSVLMSGWFADADPKVVRILTFTILLLAAFLVTNLAGSLVTRLIKMATLGWLNRLTGMFFGILKTALLLMLLIWLFDSLNSKWGLVSTDALDKSYIYSYLLDLSTRLFPRLKELVANV